MYVINDYFKNLKSGPISVLLKSGVFIAGTVKEIKDDNITMSEAYIKYHGFKFSSPLAVVQIEAIEIWLPSIDKINFHRL